MTVQDKVFCKRCIDIISLNITVLEYPEEFLQSAENALTLLSIHSAKGRRLSHNNVSMR